MLKSIQIKDYILIDELFLEFGEKLNVITGETGAGKSILINAIDIALGARANKEIIKTGKDKALIELTLTGKDISNLLDENGIDNLGDEIIITKEITQTGSRSRVNGTLVSQDFIKTLRELFVDIHSQHQTYSLLQQKNHLLLLDAYTKNLITDELNEYKNLYSYFLQINKQLAEAKNSCETTENQIDFLKFQIKEIEDAQITNPNEDEEIKNELNVLENLEKLKELTGGIYWALNNDETSILNGLSKIKYELSKAKCLDNSLSDTESELINTIEQLKEISISLREYSQNLNGDTEKLNNLQERLFLLDKLKRKYGDNLEAVIKTYEKLSDEYSAIENSTENVEKLEKEVKITEEKLLNLAEKLSQKRKEYSKILSSKILEKLKNLELNKSKFEISITPCELNETGIDRVEFLITTNISEDLKPLSKVASGGEISRVMLSIKSVFAEADEIGTLILDEIDTGISGKTSQSVAEEISMLANTHQIIIITHQAIIASKANNYIYVQKSQNSTTNVKIKTLTDDEKIKALAELASGSTDNASIDFAKTLLQNN